MSINHILALGDIIKLKQPYRPEDWVERQPKSWKGFEFGIVVEIISTQFTVNGERYGNIQIPRQVSLHLYDASGQMMIDPDWVNRGLYIPAYVDFHISQLILYKIASEAGYSTVSNPPNWDSIWEEELSVLHEFTED